MDANFAEEFAIVVSIALPFVLSLDLFELSASYPPLMGELRRIQQVSSVR
jgi:hypothetical protein